MARKTEAFHKSSTSVFKPKSLLIWGIQSENSLGTPPFPLSHPQQHACSPHRLAEGVAPTPFSFRSVVFWLLRAPTRFITKPNTHFVHQLALGRNPSYVLYYVSTFAIRGWGCLWVPQSFVCSPPPRAVTTCSHAWRSPSRPCPPRRAFPRPCRTSSSAS